MKVGFKVDNLTEMSSALADFAEFLRGQQFRDDDVFASRLVSCELITNVVAKGLDGVNIRTEVPDVFAESGRGLYIIRCFGEIEPAEEGGLTVCIKRHI